MAKIGFKSSNVADSIKREKETSKEEEQQFKEIDKILQEEAKIYQQQVANLKLQFKELSHLKHNLKILTTEYKRLHRMKDKKDKLLHQVNALRGRSKDSVDAQKALKNLQYIASLDNSIISMVQKFRDEIPRLIISETHSLYAKDEQTKTYLKELSREAEELQASVQRISRDTEYARQEVNNLNQYFQQLHKEQQKNKQWEERPKVGFNNK